MSPPLLKSVESPLVKLSYLEMAQTHMERVVGDSPGQDRQWRVSDLGGAECVRRPVSAAFPFPRTGFPWRSRYYQGAACKRPCL